MALKLNGKVALVTGGAATPERRSSSRCRWMESSLEPTERRRLHIALDIADDDPLRRQVRAAVVSSDRAFLLQVADRPDIVSLPAVTVDQLGRGLSSVKEYGAAERVLRAARDRFPSDYWLTADLGTTLLIQQLLSATTPVASKGGPHLNWPPDPARVEEIVGCFRAAVALRPESVVGYAGLALSLHILKGDPLSAEPAYRRLVELVPTHYTSHLGLAIALQTKGNLEEAAAAYRRAIEVAPTREKALAWVSLGRVLEQDDRWVEAANAYAEAIRADPTQSDAATALIRVIWLRFRLIITWWVCFPNCTFS